MKVLLLDPAFAAVPIHDYLMEIGCEVWTIGNRVHDPLALAYPERWINGDYSDVALVSELLRKHSFDALVPGCTDVSMDTFVRVGLQPHYRYTLEADQILNKKSLFRRLCGELDLPAPRTVPIEPLPDKGRYICKPADSFSGRGVTVFDAADRSAAEDAIANAKKYGPSGEIVCEEFVEGQLLSYSAFLEGGMVDTAYIVREGSRYDSVAVDTSYVLNDYSPTHTEQVRDAVEAVCRRLDLCNGLLHVQFIDTGDRIALIEMTRRCPGDLYSELIDYSTGQPYAARYASYFVGRKLEPVGTRRRHILRHTIKQMGSERFRGFDLSVGPGLFRLVPLVRLGEPLDTSKTSRSGVAFLEAPDAVALEERYREMVMMNNQDSNAVSLCR